MSGGRFDLSGCLPVLLRHSAIHALTGLGGNAIVVWWQTLRWADMMALGQGQTPHATRETCLMPGLQLQLHAAVSKGQDQAKS